MDVFEIIKKRYSCRSYRDKPVEEDVLKKILEAGRLAPSAHNAQDWKLVVVQDREKREKLAQAAGQPFVGTAPVVIAAVSLNPTDVLSSGVPTCPIDLGIIVDHLTLAATSLGLATCWVGAFDQEEVRKVLNIPAECKVVVLLPLGHPTDGIEPKVRKGLDEIISNENF